MSFSDAFELYTKDDWILVKDFSRILESFDINLFENKERLDQLLYFVTPPDSKDKTRISARLLKTYITKYTRHIIEIQKEENLEEAKVTTKMMR